MRSEVRCRYATKAGGGRAEYLGGMNAARLASRCIFDSTEDSTGLEIMSRDMTSNEARGRRAEKGPSAGNSRFGSNGMVRMESTSSRRDDGRSSG